MRSPVRLLKLSAHGAVWGESGTGGWGDGEQEDSQEDVEAHSMVWVRTRMIFDGKVPAVVFLHDPSAYRR